MSVKAKLCMRIHERVFTAANMCAAKAQTVTDEPNISLVKFFH